CGNVRPGESYESCAHRRLREELGINGVKLTRVYKFMYQVQCDPGFSEHELDTVYVGEYSGEVAPNPLEVLAVKWVPWEGKETGQALLPRLAPWFEIMMTDQRLMEQTVPFAQQPITPSFLSNLATNTTL
ncbi:NUDIX domain-containing protein, partial [Candidatus Woesebacteria bacterium]|nr:NUDIX domain-containing protein [Candidatus Woesebacteria bacterium]